VKGVELFPTQNRSLAAPLTYRAIAAISPTPLLRFERTTNPRQIEAMELRHTAYRTTENISSPGCNTPVSDMRKTCSYGSIAARWRDIGMGYEYSHVPRHRHTARACLLLQINTDALPTSLLPIRDACNTAVI